MAARRAATAISDSGCEVERARRGLRGNLRALEMLMRRAVVAVREGRARTRVPLARRCAAAGDPAVERAGLDLLLDEGDRCGDALLHRPGDLRLRCDREVAADVPQETPIGLARIERDAGQ